MNPNDLPSNSHASKQQAQQPQKTTKIISGTVSGDVGVKQTTAKKLEKAMFAEDVGGALSDIFWKRILPEGKNAIVRGFHYLLDAFFNMNGTSVKPGQTNYNAQYIYPNSTYPGTYINVSSNQGQNYQQISNSNSGIPNGGDLVFNTPDDAQKILENLRESINETGYVTVNMLYGWLGRALDYTWANYGWVNLDSASIMEENGRFRLRLPKASPIDKN